MTVEKMLWDVWRNVTSATTGWSLGGNNNKGSASSSLKSAQRTRYNRLKSSGRPTKSISQPANLTGLCSTTIYSSSESLEGFPPDDLSVEKRKDLNLNAASASSSTAAAAAASGTEIMSTSGIAPKGNGRKLHGSGGGVNNAPSGSFMKHSISSFFPFTSCTSTTSSTSTYHHQTASDKGKTISSGPSTRESPLEKSTSTMVPSSSTSTSSSSASGSVLVFEGQREFPNNGTDFLSNISNGSSSRSSGRGSAYGNSQNKISLQQSSSSSSCIEMEDNKQKGRNSFWDNQRDRKEVPQQEHDQIQDIICEDDISDLDDDVEHLTCDVCDRAFPTLKQLAAHQRKKRHYGCLQCDSIFPTREVLEYHREQMNHYDYVIDVYEEGDDDGTDFFESEDDEHGLREDEDCDDEERERLL